MRRMLLIVALCASTLLAVDLARATAQTASPQPLNMHVAKGMVGPEDEIWTPDPPDAARSIAKAMPEQHGTDSLATATAAGTPVTVIRIKLNDPRVHVGTVLAKGFPHGDESFATMLGRSHPTIAIDGTFFCKRSLNPIGDIVINGRLVYQGLMGTALALRPGNDAVIRRVVKDHAEDWSGFDTVMACGPALVLRGQIDVRATQEGFHDPHMMTSTLRLGVGLNDRSEMLMVSTHRPLGFEQWARVMQALGCTDAMNLDAGASLAMYYRGRTLLRPSRRLTNLLTVTVDR